MLKVYFKQHYFFYFLSKNFESLKLLPCLCLVSFIVPTIDEHGASQRFLTTWYSHNKKYPLFHFHCFSFPSVLFLPLFSFFFYFNFSDSNSLSNTFFPLFTEYKWNAFQLPDLKFLVHTLFFKLAS